MDNERDDIIMMEDENGNPVEMIALEMLDYEEKTYVLMQTTDETDENSYIFEYEEEDDDAILTPVEDDNLVDKLFELFIKKMDMDSEEEEEE
ncbi:MAG: DUF1292 domain-containing protein [Clostridia bacterium]|nr:DUF1292 domain-containing protein [Clostridia bacterium]MDD3093122.1 DUF1292 domain-containing protein [Clostridia bacterium]HXK72560.1 DUF1292 domain-containing protein [Clostridia bacterium]